MRIRRLSWGASITAGVGLIVLPLGASRYLLFLLYLILLNIALAQSWNLVGGYTGLISLGHAAFFGLGAYTAAILIRRLGAPLLPSAIAGGLVAAAFSAIISVPTFRFRGIYFAIGTLILAEALRIWMINWELTGGAQGISLPPASAPSLTEFYYLMLVIAVGSTALLAVILRTKLGIGLRAIRDNEDVAQNMGVNTFRTKLYAFLLSAFIAGLTGGVHAAKLGVIEPYSIFSSVWTISIVNIVIIGGIGTVFGPILGAIFITLLSEVLVGFYTFHLMITGIIFILVIRFVPAGIWGRIRSTRLASRIATAVALE
jgi:branched-chain amino acid transport system permease protein